MLVGLNVATSNPSSDAPVCARTHTYTRHDVPSNAIFLHAQFTATVGRAAGARADNIRLDPVKIKLSRVPKDHDHPSSCLQTGVSRFPFFLILFKIDGQKVAVRGAEKSISANSLQPNSISTPMS